MSKSAIYVVLATFRLNVNFSIISGANKNLLVIKGLYKIIQRCFCILVEKIESEFSIYCVFSF